MARRVNFTDNPHLRVLVYGKPGAGKTRFAGTAALDDRTSPVLWLDASGNPESLYNNARRPDVIKIEDLKDLNDPYRWIMNGQKPNEPFAQEFKLKPPYKTLVIDHITDVQRLSYRVVLGTQKAMPGDFNPALEWSHHGRVLGQMLNFSAAYFNVPLHVIMTAHEKRTTDERGNLIYLEPLLWGQAGSAVPGYALIVGRLVPGVEALMAENSPILNEMGISRQDLRTGAKTVLFVGQSAKYAGKDQYGVLGSHLVNPTIPDIMDKLDTREWVDPNDFEIPFAVK